MGTFIRLIDFDAKEKETQFDNLSNYYMAKGKDFLAINGSPYAYWLGDNTKKMFEKGNMVGKAELRMGLTTGNNDYYLRFWFEPCWKDIGIGLSREEAKESKKKWFPYDKGGEYRKWYGNRDYVVNWYDDGHEMQTKLHPSGTRIWAHNFNLEYNFISHISWNDIVTNRISFRYFEKGFLFDSAAATAFIKEKDIYTFLGYLNSNIVDYLAKILNPTLHFKLGDFEKLPCPENVDEKIEVLVKENIDIAKKEWNSHETAWEFTRTTLAKGENKGISIKDKYSAWEKLSEEWFYTLKSNEEKINTYFINRYGLEKEISGAVEDCNVSLRKADLQREIKALISYAVGCIMGRYSLKEDGLIYAGGEWNSTRYSDEFKPCEYGVIPITEEQYFEEDLCTRVIDFIKVVYGEDTLAENLKFIASAIKPGSFEAPKKVIREYLFNGFFDNHYQIYQHRPIYWQLDSGKAGGFRAIVYMHRYSENTLPIVRTEYIQELRYKYEEEMQRLQHRAVDATTTAEKNAIKKEITAIDKKLVECTAYDDLLNHATSNIQNYTFDLDDGVKTNYAKFLSVDGDKSKNILTVIKL